MNVLLVALVLFPAPATRTLSEYGDEYHGRTMADGGTYRRDDAELCATNDWKLGTRLTITVGDKSAVFVVRDRMAKRFTGKRIDLSPAGIKKLGGNSGGLTKNAKVEVVR